MTNTSISCLRRTCAFLMLPMAAATLMAGAPTAAFGQEYGVTVKVAKKPELARVKSYSWERGHQAFDKAVDAQIRAAIDRELTARGLTKIESGPADVVATYSSLTRLDADLKSTEADGTSRLYPVGTLVIDLLDPKSRQPLFRVRVDKPISADRVRLEAIINEVVAAMFQKYPTPAKTK